MFCRLCGAQITESAEFCTQCGGPVRSDRHVAGGCADTTDASTMPMESVTVPAPAVPPGVVAQTVPARRHRPTGGLVAGLVIVGLLVVAAGFGALYVTGALESLGVAPPTKTTSSVEGDRDAEESPGADAADGSEQPPSADESYDVLVGHYATLWTLHSEIGIANADGTYGGVGFAYEVFNPKIGHPDQAVRSQLVAECQALADKVMVSRQDLASAVVADEYVQQLEALLGLYDLLDARVQAMLGAATVAVSDPGESAWRPTLSPMSVDARRDFEAAYPGAVPVRP